jgi:hypothetical protein
LRHLWGNDESIRRRFRLCQWRFIVAVFNRTSLSAPGKKTSLLDRKVNPSFLSRSSSCFFCLNLIDWIKLVGASEDFFGCGCGHGLAPH